MTIKKKIISLFTAVVIAISGTVLYCNAETVDTEQQQTQPIVQKTETTVKSRKSEIKHVIKKFAVSMSWVFLSIIVILAVLLVYKKLGNTRNIKTNKEDISKNLNSPETVEEATRFFIEKF